MLKIYFVLYQRSSKTNRERVKYSIKMKVDFIMLNQSAARTVSVVFPVGTVVKGSSPAVNFDLTRSNSIPIMAAQS